MMKVKGQMLKGFLSQSWQALTTANANTKQCSKPTLRDFFNSFLNILIKCQKSLKSTQKSKHVINSMQNHYCFLFVVKCVCIKSSGTALAVDIALWNINKGMVIPSPMGNYLIMANTGWRTNAESNNKGNILNLIARGKRASVNYFWANKKWFYFRFNTHHCRKKKTHFKLHDLRNIHLKLTWRVNKNEDFLFQMSITD